MSTPGIKSQRPTRGNSIDQMIGMIVGMVDVKSQLEFVPLQAKDHPNDYTKQNNGILQTMGWWFAYFGDFNYLMG